MHAAQAIIMIKNISVVKGHVDLYTYVCLKGGGGCVCVCVCEMCGWVGENFSIK